MSNYTIEDLRADLERINFYLAISGSVYFITEQGRYNRQNIDFNRIDLEGKRHTIEHLEGGSSRDCITKAWAVLKGYEGYIFPYDKKELTRIQALRVCTRAGIDFNLDFHSLSYDQKDLLLVWARLTRYKKPAGANGSRTRYFFNNLNRLKKRLEK